MKVMMHGSRLNELLAVGFTNNDKHKKINYVLYNPSSVKTEGMQSFYKNPFIRSLTNLMSQTVEEAGNKILILLDNLPSVHLAAFKQRKRMNIDKSTFDTKKAQRLFDLTTDLLNSEIN